MKYFFFVIILSFFRFNLVSSQKNGEANFNNRDRKGTVSKRWYDSYNRQRDRTSAS